MTALSIDPAYAKPPVIARWDDSQLRQIHIGLDRGLVKRRAFDAIYIEDQFFGQFNTESIKRVAHAAGHLLGVLGVDLDEAYWVSPSDWKRKAGGKANVALWVRSCLRPHEIRVLDTTLGLTANADRRTDIYDSVGIGLVSLGRSPLTAPRGDGVAADESAG